MKPRDLTHSKKRKRWHQRNIVLCGDRVYYKQVALVKEANNFDLWIDNFSDQSVWINFGKKTFFSRTKKCCTFLKWFYSVTY